MICSTRKIVARILTLLLLAFLMSCERFIYSTEASNIGTHGILVTDISYFRAKSLHQRYGDVDEGIDIPAVYALYPTFPRTGSVGAQRFEGFSGKLPDKISVTWKLAELTNCKEVLRVKSSKFSKELISHGYDPEEHVRKSGCKWKVLEGKTYRKTINMDTIRATDAYKRTGKRYEGIGGSQYVLRLRFEFQDENLKFIAYNDVTNPWK